MIEFTDAQGVKQSFDPSKPFNLAYNVDCMELMKQIPDKFFDLAVVDPPYGGGFTEGGGCKGWFSKYHQDSSQNIQVEREREKESELEISWGRQGPRPVEQISCNRYGGRTARYGKKIISWDVAPKKEYFDELFRVSRNAVIWGANYFSLPPTRCFLVWDKLTISESFSMAMCEYAWTSFNQNAKRIELAPQGSKSESRFHPTQKPIELYEWIYRLFAKKGDKILDTHLGSASSRIAAYKAGLDFVGCEIDPTYYRLAEERFDAHASQQSLFL